MALRGRPIRTFVSGMLVLAHLSASLYAGAEPQTPEEVVRALFAAFNEKDLKRMAKYVEGAYITPGLENLERQNKGPGIDDPFVEVKALSLEASGDSATGTITLRIHVKAAAENPNAGGDFDLPDLEIPLALNRVKGQWMFRHPTRQEVRDGPTQEKGNSFAAMVAYPEEILVAREEAKRANCLKTIKLIGDAARRYGQERKRWDLTSAALHKKLMPLVKDARRFQCPDQPEVKYCFNPKLYGISEERVAQPDNTVLIYEGKDGALTYGHDGAATVTFVSGRVAAITPEDVRRLKWTR